jgi:amidase
MARLFRRLPSLAGAVLAAALSTSALTGCASAPSTPTRAQADAALEAVAVLTAEPGAPRAPAASVPPALAASSGVPRPDLAEATVAELQARMESGAETARSLVEGCFLRIAATDRQGPELHSLLELNPDALATADALDAERRERGPRGPLHGIPVLLKDNIATGDRMSITAGSLALQGCVAPRDAHLVARLRAAGAVILGKTNLSEWANIRSTRSSSGWSARGGQTRNAYAPDRNPSGSSSGSAVAVAASLAPLAVGTETDGSIVSPASANGIVGIKPTLGVVSRTGIVPIAHSQDTAGPMARTVADAALLLAVMAGPDADDAVTAEGAARMASPLDALLGPDVLDRDGLRGARLGVVREGLMGYSAEADALMEAAIADLRRLGAEIVDPVVIPTLGRLDAGEMTVLLHELKADLAAYCAWLGPATTLRTLDDVIAFNAAHAEREMTFFGQELFEQAAAKGPLTDAAYLAALEEGRRLAGPEGIDAALDAHDLDALVAPTGGPAWRTDHEHGDAYSGGSSTPAAVAGYPHVTVPMGLTGGDGGDGHDGDNGDGGGLPVGLSFFGRAWSEPVLIRLAFAYEQGSARRRAPQLATTPSSGEPPVP